MGEKESCTTYIYLVSDIVMLVYGRALGICDLGDLIGGQKTLSISEKELSMMTKSITHFFFYTITLPLPILQCSFENS